MSCLTMDRVTVIWKTKGLNHHNHHTTLTIRLKISQMLKNMILKFMYLIILKIAF